jgi:outer membrane protein assembly factor BamA
MGSDADRFSVYLGYPDLLRGYTSGSFRRNECLNTAVDPQTVTGCAALDQLVGTSIATVNAEVRFPILSPLWEWLPRGIPPIEGAVFYDAGVAWDGNSKVVLRDREEGESVTAVRTPLQSWGVSARMNLFGLLILRADWAKPIKRPGTGGFWTISIGPTF